MPAVSTLWSPPSQVAEAREHDLRSALELYQRVLRQRGPESSGTLGFRGHPVHFCLPIARILRDLRQWEEALQWITEGIWQGRLQAAEPPLRGAFTTQAHLEGELSEHLTERVRILEGWLADQPELADRLAPMLANSKQALGSQGTKQIP